VISFLFPPSSMATKKEIIIFDMHHFLDQVTYSYVITVHPSVILTTNATISQAKKESFYSFSIILHHQKLNTAI
jgi:hypothetical protein